MMATELVLSFLGFSCACCGLLWGLLWGLFWLFVACFGVLICLLVVGCVGVVVVFWDLFGLCAVLLMSD